MPSLAILVSAVLVLSCGHRQTHRHNHIIIVADQRCNYYNNNGVFNSSVLTFLNGLGRMISEISGKARETGFLFQRLSVTLQRFNAVLLHNSLQATDRAD